jgi:hypothetical protein
LSERVEIVSVIDINHFTIIAEQYHQFALQV